MYRKFGICRICFRKLADDGTDSRRPEGELVKGRPQHEPMMTDPIADMLTRIRNAVRVERPHVDMPLSKVKRGLAEVLKREGYIWDWEEVRQEPGQAASRCT